MPARQSLQCAQRIGNHDHRPRGIQRRAAQTILCYQSSAGAVAECVGEKTMPVGLLALKGHKERARSGAARVGADAVNYQRRRSAPQFTSDFMGYTLKFCRDQRLFAPVSTVYGISLGPW